MLQAKFCKPSARPYHHEWQHANNVSQNGTNDADKMVRRVGSRHPRVITGRLTRDQQQQNNLHGPH